MFSLERERLAGLGPLPLHLHAGVPARPEGRAGPGRGAARLGERPAGAALRQAAPAGLAAQQLGEVDAFRELYSLLPIRYIAII